jgi:hypothetical protein
VGTFGSAVSCWGEFLANGVAAAIERGQVLVDTEYSDDAVDEVNREALKRYEWWHEEELRNHFRSLQYAIELLIHRVCSDDPHSAFREKGLYDERLYPWLYNAVVEHYVEHCPPNGVDLQHLMEGRGIGR